MILTRVPLAGLVGAAAIAGAIALASQGCTVTSTNTPLTDDGGSTGDDSSSQQDTGVSNPCYSCLDNICRAQSAVCDGNPECNAIYQCATAPACVTDQTCITACYNAHPNGQTQYLALSNCDTFGECGSCMSICATPVSSCTAADSGTDDSSAADGAATEAAAPNACNDCVTSACATQNTACGSGTDCEAYTQCLQGCANGDSACASACDSAHAQGKSDAANLAQCTVTNCSAPCGL